jgi:signal peptidase I
MKKWLREYLSFALMVLGLFAARSSLADHYYVPSGSMEPTLMPGDRVVVDKEAYGLRIPFTLHKLGSGTAPARGDVVIFDSPEDGTRLIKRVVAVAGDTVAVKDGHVSINGIALAPASNPALEKFGDRTARLELQFGGGPDVAATRIPEGALLVLGDARGNSRDGRFFGLVREEEIYAKAARVYFRSGEGFVWIAL